MEVINTEIFKVNNLIRCLKMGAKEEFVGLTLKEAEKYMELIGKLTLENYKTENFRMYQLLKVFKECKNAEERAGFNLKIAKKYYDFLESL